MRYCNDKCGILKIVNGTGCPILNFTKTRKQSDWYFVKGGEKIVPLCEEKHGKTRKKKGLFTI